MRLVHLLDLPEVPWRNGGGVTREIAAFHDSAVHPDFLWRVSMATVNAPGPFSRFDGVDRSLAVLDGDGIMLEMADGDHVLTQYSPPFAFSGEASVQAEVIGATTCDLNAMTRRGHFTHTMRRNAVNRAAEFTATGAATILVMLGDVTVTATGQSYSAKRLDALIDIGAGARMNLSSSEPAEVLAVEIHRVWS